MDLLLANPRGFCVGVDRAIETVERALALRGVPNYARHEVVHIKLVLHNLRQKGVLHELRRISEGVVFPLPEALNYDAITRCPSAQPMRTFVSLDPTSPWNMACNGEK